eukprot:CAMPEP_0117423748 /NCGR_PEP_ID=MMETSP0758-20121206/4301_1 /TAXON_ID=63605 /ORGANISM="Percolomonas cosmopolitus, Strain AE-1 (ATCC 50343)" /LENGTH=66 /DNA_ID=CAMNT_0005207105 /DNA_START=553 /DNA_END=750 /DNA_ORIENTATION=+
MTHVISQALHFESEDSNDEQEDAMGLTTLGNRPLSDDEEDEGEVEDIEDYDINQHLIQAEPKKNGW